MIQVRAYDSNNCAVPVEVDHKRGIVKLTRPSTYDGWDRVVIVTSTYTPEPRRPPESITRTNKPYYRKNERW